MNAANGPSRQCGFTLIELVMVIVIMGVIGGIVSVFMKGPIDAYFASARRAALTDVADTTVRRMARDIRKALPNSIRIPDTIPPNQCIEFIPTKTGGRYRAEVDAALPLSDALDFTDPLGDQSFDMLGANSAIPEQAIAPGDVIAVYNLGPGQNDAYLADNTATVKTVSTANPANITLLTAKKFPFASGSNRFHVIPKGELVVAYVCGGDSLYRTSSSTFTSACPTTGAVLANKVKPGSCSFVFDPSQQRNALVQVSLSFTDKGETVNLYHDVHVDNTP